MKQVKWPGLNHARLGGVFTDEVIVYLVYSLCP